MTADPKTLKPSDVQKLPSDGFLPCHACGAQPSVFRDNGGFNAAHICWNRSPMVLNYQSRELCQAAWNKMEASY